MLNVRVDAVMVLVYGKLCTGFCVGKAFSGHFNFNGKFQIGDHVIRCAARYGHGVLNISRAIVVSCNPFFLNLGVKCGLERLANYFEAAGFGAKTGFELSDLAGLSPSQELARRFWKRKWLAVDTAYASMGQGGIAITPLQAAVFYGAIANGGTLYKPYLIDHICKQDPLSGKPVTESSAVPVETGTLAASERSLHVIREAMHQVVHDSRGSGRRGDIPIADLYGKTGTANVEARSGAAATKNTWFNGFVTHPGTGELLSFAAVIENGESGGGTTAPLVARMFMEWFSRQ